MRRIALAVLLAGVTTLGLGGCGSTPVSGGLVTTAATGCVRGERELCRLYQDLRLWESIRERVEEQIRPSFEIVPVPCPADGPGCPWRARYEDRLRAGFTELYGEPTPQPSKSLPFALVPAEVQLERAVALRQGLMQAVSDLDREIESLQAAAD